MADPNQRAELDRLRKMKRLRELEAKAGGAQQSPPQPNQMPSQQHMEDPLGGPPVVPFGSKPDLLDDPFAYSPPVQQQAKPKEPAGYWERVGRTNPLEILDSMASGMTNAAYFGFDDEIAGAASKAGVPGLDNYKANQDRMQAEQPSAFMGGQMSTAFAPFGAANAILKPKTILGTSALGGATGSAQGGLQGFGDTDGTFSERLEGGNEGAKTGALFGVALGGGLAAAPRAVSAMKGGEGRSQLGDILEGIIEPGTVDASGIKALDRFLAQNKIRLDDNTVRRINSSINSAIELGADSASLPVRLKDVLVESLDGGNGQFKQALETQLRGSAVIGGDAGNAVLKAVDEDLPASRKFVNQSLDSTLGSQSRLKALDDIQERLTQIGKEGYEPMLKAGPVSEEGAEALEKVLQGPGMSKLYQPLETIAAGEGVDLATMLRDNPLEAAHWMQSKARQLSARSSDNVTSSAFTALRKRLLSGLDAATDGSYNIVRKQYGDEFGNQEALEFGDRFLTRASKDLDVDLMAREFGALSEGQKEAALLSVRDALKSATGRGAAGTAPRLTRVKEEQVQDALRRVFGERGDKVASNIQKTEDFVQSRKRVDPRNGSPTASNQEAAKAARANVQSPMRRKVGGALQSLSSDAALSSGFGAFAPVRTFNSTLGALGKAVSGDSSGKLNALAELLEAPVSTRNKLTSQGLNDQQLEQALKQAISNGTLPATATIQDLKRSLAVIQP